jgi:hypothetical protein
MTRNAAAAKAKSAYVIDLKVTKNIVVEVVALNTSSFEIYILFQASPAGLQEQTNST